MARQGRTAGTESPRGMKSGLGLGFKVGGELRVGTEM